jgi:hypothetical protein
MNWGAKIAILYTGFVILILTMVGLTMGQKQDLVAKDYYYQEIHYQDKIDEENRTLALPEQLSWELKHKQLIVRFPERFKGRTTLGSLHFFRPSDASLDTIIPLPADTLRIRTVDTDHLKMGLYKLQVSWEADGNKYFNEGIVQIN